MATVKGKYDWLGQIKGHVSENTAKIQAYLAEHDIADAEGRILRKEEVKGAWDGSRVLWTTMGGKLRPLTAEDVATFRTKVHEKTKKGTYKNGITAKQVIDLSSSKPLFYSSNVINGGKPPKYAKDLDKARGEIRTSIPVSNNRGVFRFLTNAGPESKVSRHTVTVEFLGWDAAMGQLAGVKLGDTKAITSVARKMRSGYLRFDCDCERHRYFFRYVASVLGFAYGKKEEGYPKIRNPNLLGCACKHVIRTMAEIQSSGTCLGFLTKALARANDNTMYTLRSRKDAEEALKKQKASARIKTSEQRKAEAKKAADRRAAKKAQEKKVNPPKKQSPAMRRFIKAVANMEKTMGQKLPEEMKKQLAASFGLTI